LFGEEQSSSGILLSYIESFAWQSESSNAPFFRSAFGRAGTLTSQPLRNIDICRMVKRRLSDAGASDSPLAA